MKSHHSDLATIIILFVAGSILIGCNPINGPLESTQTPSFLFPTPTSTSFDQASTLPLPTHTASATLTVTPLPSPTQTEFSPVHVFPVQPIKNIGYAEGTSAHGYPATDIFAPAGWQFVAVTEGVVDFVSYKDTWDATTDDPATRGGLSVAIIGEDGMRYYGSHLSKIAEGISPGVHVTAGQLLGYIGESGDARGRGTHLHFGISRPTYPEDWKARRGEIDPYPFLVAWAKGINLIPFYPTLTPKAPP